MNKLVVFDTGTGGEIFAAHLRQNLPNIEVIEQIDYANSPYGSRPPEEITTLVKNALSPYLGASDTAILLACNTATTISINILRAEYPNQVFFGVEPMLKPAATATKNGKILCLATPATLISASFQAHKAEYCSNCQVFEPQLGELAHMIDQKIPVKDYLQEKLSPYQGNNPDLIILACTHYLAIEQEIQALFPNATIFNPLNAVTKQIQKHLK